MNDGPTPALTFGSHKGKSLTADSDVLLGCCRIFSLCCNCIASSANREHVLLYKNWHTAWAWREDLAMAHYEVVAEQHAATEPSELFEMQRACYTFATSRGFPHERILGGA